MSSIVKTETKAKVVEIEEIQIEVEVTAEDGYQFLILVPGVMEVIPPVANCPPDWQDATAELANIQEAIAATGGSNFWNSLGWYRLLSETVEGYDIYFQAKANGTQTTAIAVVPSSVEDTRCWKTKAFFESPIDAKNAAIKFISTLEVKRVTKNPSREFIERVLTDLQGITLTIPQLCTIANIKFENSLTKEDVAREILDRHRAKLLMDKLEINALLDGARQQIEKKGDQTFLLKLEFLNRGCQLEKLERELTRVDIKRMEYTTF